MMAYLLEFSSSEASPLSLFLLLSFSCHLKKNNNLPIEIVRKIHFLIFSLSKCRFSLANLSSITGLPGVRIGPEPPVLYFKISINPISLAFIMLGILHKNQARHDDISPYS